MYVAGGMDMAGDSACGREDVLPLPFGETGAGRWGKWSFVRYFYRGHNVNRLCGQVLPAYLLQDGTQREISVNWCQVRGEEPSHYFQQPPESLPNCQGNVISPQDELLVCAENIAQMIGTRKDIPGIFAPAGMAAGGRARVSGASARFVRRLPCVRPVASKNRRCHPVARRMPYLCGRSRGGAPCAARVFLLIIIYIVLWLR